MAVRQICLTSTEPLLMKVKLTSFTLAEFYFGAGNFNLNIGRENGETEA